MRYLVLATILLTHWAGCSPHWIEDYRPTQTTYPKSSYTLPSWQHHQLFLAEATLNAQGPYTMILDSGIYGIRLDEEVAQALKADHLRQNRAGPTNTLSTLQIGDWHAQALLFEAQDLSDISTALGTRIDGILGLNPFFDGLITYDYAHGVVTISEGHLQPDPFTYVFAYDEVFRPTIAVQIGKRRTQVMIDTGAATGILLPDDTDLTWKTPPTPQGQALTLSGATPLRIGQVATDAMLGPIVLPQPWIGIRAGPAVVGSNVLQDYIVTFDQHKKLVQFRPAR